MKPFLHCLPDFSTAVEKFNSILVFDPLQMTCFFFLSNNLQYSLSLILINFTIICFDVSLFAFTMLGLFNLKIHTFISRKFSWIISWRFSSFYFLCSLSGTPSRCRCWISWTGPLIFLTFLSKFSFLSFCSTFWKCF